VVTFLFGLFCIAASFLRLSALSEISLKADPCWISERGRNFHLPRANRQASRLFYRIQKRPPGYQYCLRLTDSNASCGRIPGSAATVALTVISTFPGIGHLKSHVILDVRGSAS
jgi:hypothetical protein